MREEGRREGERRKVKRSRGSDGGIGWGEKSEFMSHDAPKYFQGTVRVMLDRLRKMEVKRLLNRL